MSKAVIHKKYPIRKKERVQKRSRLASEIMQGMKEIEAVLLAGKKPEDVFTARTIEIPDPTKYRAKDVVRLRESMHVSQSVFARLLGVSAVLVRSWECGARTPGPMACRLMDSIKADPQRYLASLRALVA